MKRHVRLLTVVFLLAMSGCGSDGPIAIHGTVTLDGELLQRGQIEFEPCDGKGPIAAAEIRDGQYKVPAMPGKKVVRITGGRLIGQHPFTEHPDSPMIEEIEPLVPACYNSETTLDCEIARGQATYDFQVKSSKP